MGSGAQSPPGPERGQTSCSLQLTRCFRQRDEGSPSALSCEPDRGSEPEVGFRALLAAASEHEVWAITLSHSVGRILDALKGDPRTSRIPSGGNRLRRDGVSDRPRFRT